LTIALNILFHMPATPYALSELATKFRQWLATVYTPEEIAELLTDDAGYPGWREVDAAFGALLTGNHLPDLSCDEEVALLYLIARNWDIGTMIAWLSPGPALSNDGPLRPADFFRLGHVLVSLSSPEFRDAKLQFAAACKKLGALTPDAQQLLQALFAEPDENAKKYALTSLAALSAPDLRWFVEQAWASVTDEYSLLACLHVAVDHLHDRDLVLRYLERASQVPGRYLQKYVTTVRQNLDNA
jgi:hypothetical protein